MRTINKVVIHHSYTPRDLALEKSVSSFDNSHRKLHPEENALGYHIAYHYIISGDGKFIQTRKHDEVGYHAGNLAVNKESIGICLTGNFDTEYPSLEQMETLNKMIDTLEIKEVIAHRDIEGITKSCPGRNFTNKMIRELNGNTPSDWARDSWHKSIDAGIVSPSSNPKDIITPERMEWIFYNTGVFSQEPSGGMTLERMLVGLDRMNNIDIYENRED